LGLGLGCQFGLSNPTNEIAFRYFIEGAGGRVSAENGGTAVEAVRRAETEG
jgi:hypothetical protein